MPGVYRPNSLADVLGSMQQQAIGDTNTSVSGLGAVAEADETVTLADSATGTAQANPAWDAGYWGSVTWG